MKLKLSPIALFIIVLIALVLGMLCNSVVEGLANKDDKKKMPVMLTQRNSKIANTSW